MKVDDLLKDILEEMANEFPIADDIKYWDSEYVKRTGWYDQPQFNQDLFDWQRKWIDPHRTKETEYWDG